MRPVNLIPPEQARTGRAAPMRTGVTVYVLIAGLLAVLGAVTLMVTTSNGIADKKVQIADLEVQEQQAQARADSLSAYAEFASAQQARTATIASLAQSRFDWQRVLRELALVIPPDVTIQSLTGSANSGVNVGSASQSALRSQINGPALSLLGCAADQPGVAALMAAIQDIDGVTRVGLDKSTVDSAPGSTNAGGSTGSSPSGPACPGGTHFSMVAAFDEATLSDGAGAGVSPTTTPAGSAPAAADEASVASAAQQQANAAQTIQRGAQQAEQAARSAGN